MRITKVTLRSVWYRFIIIEQEDPDCGKKVSESQDHRNKRENLATGQKSGKFDFLLSGMLLKIFDSKVPILSNK